MNLPAYNVVIATLDRPKSLETVLNCLAVQQHPPALVILADASIGEETETLSRQYADRLPILYLRCATRSAAAQRNAGAERASTGLVGFLDDDIEFPPDHFTKLIGAFDNETAGVSGREEGMSHRLPGPLLRLYYRLQAGFQHRDYGASLFGLAINTVPCYEHSDSSLICSPWLPSTCVIYRTSDFQAERFPDFAEYSYMEDVHLSARMARRGKLCFLPNARFVHRSGSSAFKNNVRTLARHRIKNRQVVAREILGVTGKKAAWLLFLHRSFVTVYLLRSRPAEWRRELAGTWF